MKLINLRLAGAVVLLGMSVASFGQIELKDVMRAGAADGQKYMENYMGPAIISFNNGLSSGWYNTAKTHKLFGVDLTMAVNFATIPEDMRTFDFNSVNWEVLELQPGSDNILPTAGGGLTDAALRIPAGATVEGKTYTTQIDFDAPRGIGNVTPLNSIPTPTLTLGIGLFKNTDLKIRYVPEVATNDFEFNMFGIGVMHDIKQWIPGLKLLPFDLSGFIGTTSMSSKVFIADANEEDFSVENGVVELGIATTTVQAVISKQLSVFTPYAGIGYSFTKSTLDVKGTYTYDNGVGEPSVVRDPISLDFSEGNSPRITVGGRLKLLVLTFHVDYTIQKYSTLTAGVGISVR